MHTGTVPQKICEKRKCQLNCSICHDRIYPSIRELRNAKSELALHLTVVVSGATGASTAVRNVCSDSMCIIHEFITLCPRLWWWGKSAICRSI